jgi:hypothetical protein
MGIYLLRRIQVAAQAAKLLLFPTLFTSPLVVALDTPP